MFRIAFGAVMLWSTLRFGAKGWVDAFFVLPSYHFSWPGFGWLQPWPRALLYAHFALLALCSIGLMLGLAPRLCALVLGLGVACVELFDKTYYLNHYYLIVLVCGLCAVLPLDLEAALGARRRRDRRVPRLSLVLLRAQLALVYFFAGLAKLDADWLVRAQPLATWLQAAAERPLLGPLFAPPWVAHAMAWAGALFDLSIGFLLLWPRARGWAFALLCVFHAVTAWLFPIGVFPWLMIALSPIFFAPDWPRRFAREWTRWAPRRLDRVRAARRLGPNAGAQRPRARPAAVLTTARPIGWPALAACVAYLGLQIALPLRHLAYPGAVNWTEEGFRFAWRVMLIEKTGEVELHVRDPRSGRHWDVSPRAELTSMQLQMMSTQPDMIADYARHVATRFAARGYPEVEVHADAWASLNGRPAQRLIDPSADLARPVPWLAARRDVTRLAP